MMSPKNCTGTFLVRYSERVPACYVLTVKDYDQERGFHPKNYRIKMDGQTGNYCVVPTASFKTVPELISFYRESLTFFHK